MKLAELLVCALSLSPLFAGPSQQVKKPGYFSDSAWRQGAHICDDWRYELLNYDLIQAYDGNDDAAWVKRLYNEYVNYEDAAAWRLLVAMGTGNAGIFEFTEQEAYNALLALASELAKVGGDRLLEHGCALVHNIRVLSNYNDLRHTKSQQFYIRYLDAYRNRRIGGCDERRCLSLAIDAAKNAEGPVSQQLFDECVARRCELETIK